MFSLNFLKFSPQRSKLSPKFPPIFFKTSAHFFINFIVVRKIFFAVSQNFPKFSQKLPQTFLKIYTTFFLSFLPSSQDFNMFHAFALAYPTTVFFLWPTPLFFHCFASHECQGVPQRECVLQREWVPYHFACAVRVRLRLSFFKLIQICEGKWDKQRVPLPGCDKNLNLHHINAFLQCYYFKILVKFP